MLHVKQWNKWFPNGTSKKKGEAQTDPQATHSQSSHNHSHNRNHRSSDQERISRRDLDVPRLEERHHSHGRREGRSPRPSPRPSPESSPRLSPSSKISPESSPLSSTPHRLKGPTLTRRSASPDLNLLLTPETIEKLFNTPRSSPAASPRPSPRPSFSLDLDAVTELERKKSRKPKVKRADDSETPCCICLDYSPDHALYPCGHQCLCGLCAQVFLNNNNHCLICQQPVSDVIRIYKT